jgi:hypothetical protein
MHRHTASLLGRRSLNVGPGPEDTVGVPDNSHRILDASDPQLGKKLAIISSILIVIVIMAGAVIVYLKFSRYKEENIPDIEMGQDGKPVEQAAENGKSFIQRHWEMLRAWRKPQVQDKGKKPIETLTLRDFFDEVPVIDPNTPRPVKLWHGKPKEYFINRRLYEQTHGKAGVAAGEVKTNGKVSGIPEEPLAGPSEINGNR